MNEPPSIAICICTYKRPRWITRLLDSIDAQVFEGEPPSIEIVVVDNDPIGSAREAVESRDGPWPVRYACEKARGIAPARNTSIRTASESVEWLVFVDDDEHADPRWLDTLLLFQKETGCDVVTGPVVGDVPEGTPGWIERGRFFQRERFPTGTKRDRAFTNNTLARASLIRERSPVFDETRALHGGEDTLLFRKLHAMGADIRWCDEAVVYETIPKSRTSAGWILRRAFRNGTSTAHMERAIRGTLIGSMTPLAIAGIRLAQGVLLLVPSALIGKHAAVRQVRWIVYAAGLVVGVFGHDHEEYRRDHHGE